MRRCITWLALAVMLAAVLLVVCLAGCGTTSQAQKPETTATAAPKLSAEDQAQIVSTVDQRVSAKLTEIQKTFDAKVQEVSGDLRQEQFRFERKLAESLAGARVRGRRILLADAPGPIADKSVLAQPGTNHARPVDDSSARAAGSHSPVPFWRKSMSYVAAFLIGVLAGAVGVYFAMRKKIVNPPTPK